MHGADRVPGGSHQHRALGSPHGQTPGRCRGQGGAHHGMGLMPSPLKTPWDGADANTGADAIAGADATVHHGHRSPVDGHGAHPPPKGLTPELCFSLTETDGAASPPHPGGMLHLTIDYSQLSALSATIKAGILANWVFH